MYFGEWLSCLFFGLNSEKLGVKVTSACIDGVGHTDFLELQEPALPVTWVCSDRVRELFFSFFFF